MTIFQKKNFISVNLVKALKYSMKHSLYLKNIDRRICDRQETIPSPAILSKRKQVTVVSQGKGAGLYHWSPNPDGRKNVLADKLENLQRSVFLVSEVDPGKVRSIIHEGILKHPEQKRMCIVIRQKRMEASSQTFLLSQGGFKKVQNVFLWPTMVQE